MKTSWGSFVLLTLALATTHAQQQTESAQGESGDAGQRQPFAVTERGAHHKTWERIEYRPGLNGQTVAHRHVYQELATGLHYQNEQGEWLESEAKIEILPNNTGATAAKGQHKVIFPPDVYDGQIELNLPDGSWLRSRVLGLSYFDVESGQNVLIAELTNSVGEVHGDNVVIYPNAFIDFQADLRYTYTREGFEQDVVLREKIPLPEEFGLNPQTTRLQVLTEFFNPPTPEKTEHVVAAKSGDVIPDQTLQFGGMQIGTGKAFPRDNATSESIPVGKQWQRLEGRDFLIEEVQTADLLPYLDNLSQPGGASLNPTNPKTRRLASVNRQLPSKRRMAQQEQKGKSKMLRFAAAAQPRDGFVLDYVTMNTSLTNFTFQGDTTYYISANVSLYGTNTTFEPNTVIKYAAGVTLTVNTPVTWLGDTYRPVVLLAKDDDSAGEALPDSSGNPGTAYYAANALYFNASVANTNLVLQHLRVANATRAISINTKSGHILKHVQLLNCANGLSLTNAEVGLRNALFHRVMTNFTGSTATGRVEHLTSDIADRMNQSIGSNLFVTNSVLIAVTNPGTFTSFKNYTNTTATGVFQTVYGGNHYLVTSSTNRAVGSSSINATLLAELRQKTTYPPTVYTNEYLPNLGTLSPRPIRDTNSLPDLGYHYDTVDYAFGGCHATNDLTFAAGTTVGWFRTTADWARAGQGIRMSGNITISFDGTVTAPTYFVRLNTVQEQPLPAGYGQGGIVNWYEPDVPTVRGRFLRCSALAGEIFGGYFTDDYGDIRAELTHSEFWSGSQMTYGDQMFYTNCLLHRVAYFGLNIGTTGDSLTMRNCTVIGGHFYLSRYDWYGATPVSVRDTVFDGTLFTLNDYYATDPDYTDYDFNAYTNTSNPFPIGGGNDVVEASFIWRSNWLGRFYLSVNSALTNRGSVTDAGLVGLYHFTTQTNQVKETNSIVDIGYHYVALNASGQPLDFDGDGTPDYVEDANGNGIVDGSENQWSVVITNHPASQTVNPGSSVTFTVGAAGTPLYYQWLFNGTNAIAGATSTSLTINPVYATNAGIYSAIVSNANGQVVSSNATLTVSCVSPPSGIVAWWQGESGAFDTISNYHGFFVSGGYTNGNQNRAFQFDGTNSYVLIPDAPALKPTNLTVEVWVKFDALSSSVSGSAPAGKQFLVHKQNSRPNDWFTSYALLKNSSDYFVFDIISGTQTEFVAVNSTKAQANVWYHVVGVRGSNYIQLYVNGQLAQQTTVNFQQDYGNYPLYLGSSGQPSHDGKFKGKMDEVTFYNRALSSNEIATLYYAGSIGKCAPAPKIIPGKINGLKGGSGTFTVVGSGAAPVSYQWFFNSTNAIAGATNANLTFTNLQTTDIGNYVVTLSNSVEVTTTSEALVVRECFPMLDVALVVDRSGSMTNWANSGLTRLQAAKTASSNFVDNLFTEHDQAALVSFASDVTTDQILTNDLGLIRQKIGLLTTTTETLMGNALIAAHAELTSRRHNVGALPVLVFLTDGEPDDSTASILAIATQIKNAGTHLATVGLGTNIQSTGVNLLRAMASSTNDFYQATNVVQLTNIYNLILGNICRGDAPSNQPPNITWVTPANGQLFVTSPTNIVLQATNAGGAITMMSYYNGADLIGQATNPPYQFLWQDVTNGTYALKARGTNSVTVTYDDSAVISITVNAMPVITNNWPTNIQAFDFTGSTNITITNTAWDPDRTGSTSGPVTNVQFFTWATNGAITALPGAAVSNNLQWSITWSNRIAGHYPYFAEATDNRGVKSSSPVGVFKVNPTNPPPEVWISYPTNNEVFRAGADITITAIAYGQTNIGGGTVTNVEFFSNGQRLGNDPESPYSITVCCWEPGTYTNVARATDSFGAVKVSTNLVFIVGPTVPTSGEGYWDPTFQFPLVDQCDIEWPESFIAHNGVPTTLVDGDRLYAFSSDYLGRSFWKMEGTNWYHWFRGGITHCEEMPVSGSGITVRDSQIFISGRDYIGHSAVFRLDGTSWTIMGEGYEESNVDNRDQGFPRFGSQVKFVGGDLYLFGNFESVITNGVVNPGIQYLARWNSNYSQWEQVGDALNGPVWAIAQLEGRLVIGGMFTNASGNANANCIAVLENGSWSNLGTGLSGTSYDVEEGELQSAVFSLAACGTNLFVGGDFRRAGNLSNALAVAVWDGNNWTSVAGGLSANPKTWGLTNAIVHALAIRGNDLYVGGAFDYAHNNPGTIPVANIAKASWNEQTASWTWSDLDFGLYLNACEYFGTVRSISIMEGDSVNSYDVYAGGDFGFAGMNSWQDCWALPSFRAFWGIARWRVGYPMPDSVPSVAITNPTSFTVFSNIPTSIIVAGQATSAYTNLVILDLYTNGVFVESVSIDPPANQADFAFAAIEFPKGTHNLKVIATDEAGLKGESQIVYFGVRDTNSIVSALSDQFTIMSDSGTASLNVLANDEPVSGLRVSQINDTGVNVAQIKPGHDGRYVSYLPSANLYGHDTFKYTVTNNAGDFDTASVTVKIRAKPGIWISSPTDGNRFRTNTTITVTGAAWDWDGKATNVIFYVNGDPQATIEPETAGPITMLSDTNNPAGVRTASARPNDNFTFNWSSSTAGFYTLTAAAVCDHGITNFSTPITIVLTNIAASPNLPVADISNLSSTTDSFGRDIPPIITDGLFHLQGQASDPDVGDTVSYQVLLFRPQDWESAGELPELISMGFEPFANITSGADAQGFHVGGDISGSLGTNDLTAIPNGVYDLVLRVRGGTEEELDIVRVQIDSQLKIGQFSFSEQDLVLPVNGIPLTITRTYNSLNPLSSDFGYSWTYALNSMDVEIDEKRVTVTAVDTLDDADLPPINPMNFSMRVGGGRNVTLTLPDGRRTTFQCIYVPSEFSDGSGWGYDAKWIAPPGVTARLSTPQPADNDGYGDNTIFAPWSPLKPFWKPSSSYTPMEAYDIPEYVLTTDDGTEYHITRDAAGETPPTYLYQDDGQWFGEDPNTYYIKPHPGKPRLTKIVQRSGDVIEISDTGVKHKNSQGDVTRSMFMQRDGSGRITAIFDPNSGVTDDASAANAKALVKYVYNRNTGNLIQVHRLQDRQVGTYLTNKYHYDHLSFPHYITSIEDPRGIPLARNEYDDSGKLTAVVDANGKRTEFGHNTEGRFERVIDRAGSTNTFVYNTKGNVIFVTNALNVVAATAYNDPSHPNAETAVTNALGTAQQTWALYSYNPNGYRTNIVTSPNHTNSFRYDAYGNLLWQRDPVGNVTTNGYDSSGNLVKTMQLDASGIPIAGSSTVYENGLLKETRDFNGNLTASFAYDPSGNLTNTTDANNVSRRFSYDANGNQTESAYTWTDGVTSKTVTNRSIYDAQGRVTLSVDGLGNTNRTVYNALGKVDHTVDKLGNTNSFLYDPRGNLIRTTDALGLSTYTVYDAAGRAFFTLDRNGVTGTHSYFDAAGRATNVVRVTGAAVSIQAGPISVLTSGGTPISTNSTEYFDSGWVKKRVGPDNQPTTYAYWPDGQTMYVTNALNQTTFYKYDSAGRQEYVADALNRTNRFEYDAAGRMFKTLFHNGTYTSNYFNSLGQRTVVRDQGGMLTQFGYDHTGQLTNVIKPQVIDGVTGSSATPQWTYKYDAYGRQTESIDPKVNSTTNSYDAFGREVSRWLPMGGAGTTNHYNTLGQLTNQVDFKGQRKQIRYDRFGRMGTNYYFTTPTATYPSNTVVYLYNHLGQLTNITERIGADASTGYVAALGMPGQKPGRYAALMAFVNRIPPGVQGGVLGLTLCLAGLACSSASRRLSGSLIRLALGALSPRKKSREMVINSENSYLPERVLRLWPSSILHLPASLVALGSYAAFVLRCGGTPDGTPKRLRLPSFGWRFVTILTLVALIGSDPRLEGLWTARAACTDPGNSNSSPTIRITEFSYDVEGRLAQVISPEGYINYTYDLATGRHMGTCTKNSETTFEYDALGRLWKVHAIKRNGSAINETTTYTYTEVGSRQSVSLPNGVVTTWQYDELNRLTNVANVKTSGSVLLSQFSYKLDLSGRRTNALEIIKQEDSTSPGYQTNTMTWQYDGLYRLTNEVCVAMVPSASYTNHFQYDKAGNRWSNVRIVNSGTTTVTNQYNDNDQLLKEVTLSGTTPIATNSYVYDANGSLIAKTNAPTTGTGSTNLYSYDLKNKMSQVASFGSSGIWGTNNFLYNEQGIRVRTTPNSGSPTLYLVDGNNHTGYAQVLEELSALNGSASKSYVLGDDVLGQGSGSSAGSYLLYDGHGSTRQVANSSGTVTSRYNYDAYGQTLTGTSTSAAETSLLYCGEQFDSTLNMYNLRARFYDPSNGRFNVRDAYMGSNEDPQSLHKHLYCHADPISNVDYSGENLISVLSVIGIGFVIGAASASVADYALGKTQSFSSIFMGGLFGAVAAPFAVAVPAIGIGLGIAGLAVSGLITWSVFTDPHSTPGQKIAALALVAASIYGTAKAVGYYKALRAVEPESTVILNRAFIAQLRSVPRESIALIREHLARLARDQGDTGKEVWYQPEQEMIKSLENGANDEVAMNFARHEIVEIEITQRIMEKTGCDFLKAQAAAHARVVAQEKALGIDFGNRYSPAVKSKYPELFPAGEE